LKSAYSYYEDTNGNVFLRYGNSPNSTYIGNVYKANSPYIDLNGDPIVIAGNPAKPFYLGNIHQKNHPYVDSIGDVFTSNSVCVGNIYKRSDAVPANPLPPPGGGITAGGSGGGGAGDSVSPSEIGGSPALGGPIRPGLFSSLTSEVRFGIRGSGNV
jgi:hypothetical protein